MGEKPAGVRSASRPDLYNINTTDMKKLLLFIAVLIRILPAHAADLDSIHLIPKPVELVRQAGSFTLPKQVVIAIGSQAPAVQQLAEQAAAKLARSTGYTTTVSRTAAAAAIRLTLNTAAEPQLGAEGYQLVSTPQGVSISANAPAGLFYGLQTLWQLMPKEVESAVAVQKTSWQVPAVTVKDFPRFGWRGMMFDVSRHFFIKQELKGFIDNMVSTLR